MSKSTSLWWGLVCFLLAACRGLTPQASTLTPFTGTPRAVVVDTDMAGDDWMAILYLLQRPDIAVKAVSLTGAGEAHCEPGVKNALGLITLAGEADIPVACGSEAPLQGEHTFPAPWRESVDGLFGLSLPVGANSATTQSAVELLTTTIQSSPDKVVVLTLSPLTNLAEALQAMPALADHIEVIYVMGGAVEVPGNVGVSGVGIDNQVAEWNIYIDPRAANVVFASGAPVTLVPLDATNEVPVTRAFYDRLKRQRTSPEAGFVFEVLSRNRDFVDAGGYYFWDPLAAAILTDESLAMIEARTLAVVEEEGPESGRTRSSPQGAAVRIATGADRVRSEQVLLDTLNAQ